MWNIFKSKSKKEQLETEYFQLTEKAFELEGNDSLRAAKIREKAQHLMMEIVQLDH